MTGPETPRPATPLLAGQPADGDEQVFGQPWEATAFALAVRLHETGLFTWPEWADALTAEIERAQQAGQPDTGDTYYHHWLTALEGLVAAKGATTADELAQTQRAWRRAAARTSHGHPIELAPTDFG